MKRAAIAILILALAGITAGAAFADDESEATAEEQVKEQTTCPIMGGPIDKKHFADHDGKRVYFCCPACIKAFNEDPDKYVKKLEDEGVVLEKTPVEQTTCPVMGGPIKKEHFADHDGKRVYFCCPACIKAFSEDPDKYVKKLEDEGVVLEKTPVEQTKCPIMNRAINKKFYGDHDGKRVYLCCRSCVARFKKDPAKWVKKLEDDGITLEDAPSE